MLLKMAAPKRKTTDNWANRAWQSLSADMIVIGYHRACIIVDTIATPATDVVSELELLHFTDAAIRVVDLDDDVGVKQ